MTTSRSLQPPGFEEVADVVLLLHSLGVSIGVTAAGPVIAVRNCTGMTAELHAALTAALPTITTVLTATVAAAHPGDLGVARTATHRHSPKEERRMSPAERQDVLDELRRTGTTLEVRGGTLYVSPPPSGLAADVIELIEAWRNDIGAALGAEVPITGVVVGGAPAAAADAAGRPAVPTTAAPALPLITSGSIHLAAAADHPAAHRLVTRESALLWGSALNDGIGGEWIPEGTVVLRPVSNGVEFDEGQPRDPYPAGYVRGGRRITATDAAALAAALRRSRSFLGLSYIHLLESGAVDLL